MHNAAMSSCEKRCQRQVAPENLGEMEWCRIERSTISNVAAIGECEKVCESWQSVRLFREMDMRARKHLVEHGAMALGEWKSVYRM